MKEITSKNIRNYILTTTNDLDILFDYVEQDTKATIEGILSAIYRLVLRNYHQNQSRCNYLISILDNIVDDLTSEQLKLLMGTIVDFKNNVNCNIKKKQRIEINEPLSKIDEIHNKAANKVISGIKNNKVKLLEYFIFRERNLYLIEQNLSNNNDLLTYQNQEGDNIFAVVLKKYLNLNEKEKEEIDYLYNVILLFIESKYSNEIIKNKNRYKRIIKQSKLEYKEHVIKVIEMFDPNFKISLEELENRYNIKFEFPNIIHSEINTFITDNNGRVNFTDQNCITIDGENDLCLDDALYIEKNEDGSHTLYIHIADIPSFVAFDSTTNEEARNRIETLYLRDAELPLYPEQISNRLCSLLPNNNRNVITSIYKLDSKCRLISDVPEIVKGKIRVKHKLSYEEVDKKFKCLTSDELDLLLSRLFLFSLNQRDANPNKDLYRKLENFLDFEAHHESLKTDYSPSSNIVHETMVLANHGVTELVSVLDIPYVFRELYVPDNDFISRQIEKIQTLDEKIINNETYINNLKSCYSKATYTNKKVYHKGLGLDGYSHSSSPLRRYTDAHCQYLLHEFLFNQKLDDINIQKWEYRTNELIKYVNSKKEENEIFARHYNYLSYKKLIRSRK